MFEQKLGEKIKDLITPKAKKRFFLFLKEAFEN